MNANQRNRALLLGGLVVAMVAVLYFQLRPKPSTGGGGGSSAAAVSTVQPGAPVVSVFQDVKFDVASLTENIQEVEFVYDSSQQARDPMMPLIGGGGGSVFNLSEDGTEVAAAQSDQLVYAANRKEVTGIMYDDKLPLAVIHTPGDGPDAGDQIADLGFEFDNGGIVVSEIGVNYVVLTVKVQNEEPVKITKALKEQ